VWFALAHNGNLVGCHELAEAAGVAHHDEESDTHLVSRLLAGSVAAGTPFERALLDLLPRLRGGFSFVAADGHRLYGVRDPKGLRPLFLGRLAGGWVLASETPALAAMGATTVREVEPGEVVVGEDGGLRTHRPFPPEDVEPRLCLFELVYFARADGQLNGGLVHMARHRAGAALADHAPLPVDEVHPPRPAVVVPVPDSASAAAEGFAARSGLPFGHGVLRNRDVGRSFLAPVQDRRERRVRDKLVVVPDLVRGRRVVLVDDSLVRGTTARVVVDLLRDAGAAEVHLRIASPPWRWPCYFGIAVVDAEELAAGTSSLSQIREQLGCDSLAYLPLEALLSAVDEERRGLCTGCLTGRYPVRVPRAADRPETEVLVPLPLPRPWPDRDALPRGA
jgi:amidophosphoribosyltransferase